MGHLSTASAMTFIVTRDRERSKVFYRDMLGFALVHEDPFACVFDLNGTSLRVSESKDFTPQPHTVLGWQVADIAGVVEGLAAQGIVFTVYDGFGQDALGIWTAPGGAARVAWFPDRDGNVLSVAQLTENGTR